MTTELEAELRGLAQLRKTTAAALSTYEDELAEAKEDLGRFVERAAKAERTVNRAKAQISALDRAIAALTPQPEQSDSSERAAKAAYKLAAAQDSGIDATGEFVRAGTEAETPRVATAPVPEPDAAAAEAEGEQQTATQIVEEVVTRREWEENRLRETQDSARDLASFIGAAVHAKPAPTAGRDETTGEAGGEQPDTGGLNPLLDDETGEIIPPQARAAELVSQTNAAIQQEADQIDADEFETEAPKPKRKLFNIWQREDA